MKVTVEISDSELRRVCEMTGERKKGPAIRKVLNSAIQLHRRKEIAGKFLTGEWSVELKGFEEASSDEANEAKTLNALWRD